MAFESRNPVFARSREFSRSGYAGFNAPTPSAGDLEDLYSRPSATSRDTGRMTLDDVVMRSGALFGVLLVAAALTYSLNPPAGPLLVFGSAIVGFVLAMVISFTKTIRPPLILLYAAVEGVFVGGVSDWYQTAFQVSGLVAQAVLGTLAAFAAMLALYKTGVVRATPKFQRIMLIAMVGYLVFGVVHLIGASFGWWANIYWSDGGPSLLGIALSAFGVGLASLSLVLDFDYVDQGIRNGLPERYAWMAAFALVVTLVWLYLEMLRLLAILQGGRR